MRADIAVRDGAEQGVGQGVQRHVAVRMGEHAAIGRDLHPAQPDMVAGGEGVHVEAGAEAGHVGGHGAGSRRWQVGGGGREGAVRLDQVGGLGDLAVGDVAREHHHRQAGPFGEGAVVGEAVEALRGGVPVGAEERAEDEGLGGLDRAQVLPGRGLVDPADAGRDVDDALDRVGDRHARNGRTVVAPGRDRPGDQRGIHVGARRIVDQHDLGRVAGGQGLETGAHRKLTRRAAFDGLGDLGAKRGREFLQAALEEVRRVGGDHRLDPRDRVVRRERRQGAGQDRLPADPAVLLGRTAADADAAPGRHHNRGDAGSRAGGSGGWRAGGGHGRRTREVLRGGSGGQRAGQPCRLSPAAEGARRLSGGGPEINARPRLPADRTCLIVVQNDD